MMTLYNMLQTVKHKTAHILRIKKMNVLYWYKPVSECMSLSDYIPFCVKKRKRTKGLNVFLFMQPDWPNHALYDGQCVKLVWYANGFRTFNVWIYLRHLPNSAPPKFCRAFPAHDLSDSDDYRLKNLRQMASQDTEKGKALRVQEGPGKKHSP